MKSELLELVEELRACDPRVLEMAGIEVKHVRYAQTLCEFLENLALPSALQVDACQNLTRVNTSDVLLCCLMARCMLGCGCAPAAHLRFVASSTLLLLYWESPQYHTHRNQQHDTHPSCKASWSLVGRRVRRMYRLMSLMLAWSCIRRFHHPLRLCRGA